MAQGDIIKIMRQNGNGSQLVGMNKNQVGLNNVDNTADVDKPISTAQNDRFNSVEAIANAAAPQATTYTKTEVAGSTGRINSPLLNLPLKNSLDYETGNGQVTFVRSTTATYIDRYGVLKTAAIDEPRFEKEGILIEGGSTNLSLSSEDSTKWVKKYMTTEVDNATDTPYGVAGAVKASGDSTSDDTHYVDHLSEITSGTDKYTASIFIKKGTRDKIKIASYITGGTTVTLECIFTFSTEKSDINDVKVKKLSNGWFRIAIPIIDNDSNNDHIRWRVCVNDGKSEDTSSDYVYIFGGQIEKLPFASSYIPTVDAAVTRGKDVTSVTSYNNLPSKEEGAISIDFNMLTTYDNFNYIYGCYESSSNNLRVYISTSGYLNVKNGSDLAGTILTPISLSTDYNLIISWKNNLMSVYLDGTLSYSSIWSGDLFPDGLLESTPVAIGRYKVSATGLFGNGIYSNFITYDTELTPTEAALLGGK